MTIILLPLIFISCTNPFSPKLHEASSENLLSDQTTVNGVFQNWRYSYQFKDTTVYGDLLHNDFVFVYKNYDIGVDVNWNREEDMIATHNMFNGTQNLDLIWNEAVIAVGDTSIKDISRGFSLTVMISPTDVLRVQGRANIRLKRNSTLDPWKIFSWRDESNY